MNASTVGDANPFITWGFALFFLTFAFWIGKRKGYFSFPSLRQNTVPIPFSVFVIGFSLYLFIELFLPSFLLGIKVWFEKGRIPSVQDFHIDTTSQGWLAFFTTLITTGAVILFSLYQNPARRSTIWNRGQRPPPVLEAAKMGAVSCVMSYPFVIFVGQTFYILMHHVLSVLQEPVDQSAVRYLKNLMDSPGLFVSMVIVIIGLVPIAEELLFRGFLQTWLLRYVTKVKGIAIVSFLFAMMHFSFEQGMANIEILSALFVLSCFLGFIYERQGSLWASITLHSVFNCLNVLLIFARL